MSVRISVLLPVFNAEATIAAAITSIREQTCASWELLVIDDGSTDETSQIVAVLGTQDARIRVIRRAHEGLVAALNSGLMAARGDYIARMDADDQSAPDRLALQAAWLDTHGDIGLVSGLVEFGGDRAASAGYALHVDWINSLITPDEISRNRFVEAPFAHPSVMFRRSVVQLHGGYRAGDFPEDYELWLRWLDAGVRMAKVPRLLLRWNDSGNRLSRSDARYHPEKFFRTKASWIAREVARTGRGRPVWVWGAGRPTRKRASVLEDHGVRISGYIDIDPKKTGRAVGGVPVVSSLDLPAPGDAFVLGYVSSRGARDLIRCALHTRGYTEPADFLMCA